MLNIDQWEVVEDLGVLLLLFVGGCGSGGITVFMFSQEKNIEGSHTFTHDNIFKNNVILQMKNQGDSKCLSFNTSMWDLVCNTTNIHSGNETAISAPL